MPARKEVRLISTSIFSCNTMPNKNQQRVTETHGLGALCSVCDCGSARRGAAWVAQFTSPCTLTCTQQIPCHKGRSTGPGPLPVQPGSGRWAGSHAAALHACSTWGSTGSSVRAQGLLGSQAGSVAVRAGRNAPERQMWLWEEGLALRSALRGP